MMHKITGKFVKIIYCNSERSFCVLSCKLAPHQDQAKARLGIAPRTSTITVVDRQGDFELKLAYELKLTVQPSVKYGRRYNVHSRTVVYRSSYDTAVAFLASRAFPGVGSSKAQRIMDAIGMELFDNPAAHQAALEALVGKKCATTIITNLITQNSHQQLHQRFNEQGLSLAVLDRALQFLTTEQLLDLLANCPFRLLEDLPRADFIELDRIAQVFWNDYTLAQRNCYMLLWVTYELEQQSGSTIIAIDTLFARTQQYYPLERLAFKVALQSTYDQGWIIIHSDKRHLSTVRSYNQEKTIATRLLELARRPRTPVPTAKLIFKNLDPTQQHALQTALEAPVTIITGPPGTGKTLLIDLLMTNLKARQFRKIELLAPTGKAATQISIRTKWPAKTIHSFLRYNKRHFEVNARFPADTEVIIIDEFSMLNIFNFYSVLVATPRLKRLVLIGDKNQLPSIGPGYLLNDLIAAARFPVVTLSQIYRQQAGSNIIQNALLINQGKVPQFDSADTLLIPVTEASQAAMQLQQLVQNYLATHQDLTKQQILVPTYGGGAGIDQINNLVQTLVHSETAPLFVANNVTYYLNDKVIQLENDTEKNVFNGEIGYISGVQRDPHGEVTTITVRFEAKQIRYTRTEFSQALQLAYAVSVHKFQGSECRDVVLVLLADHAPLLSKKLLYTAYTRASQNICLISNLTVLAHALQNDGDSHRRGNLLALLK